MLRDKEEKWGRKMSTSSRSAIFSLRSKKSKDSAELYTHAGPAYDDLPMSPRLPIIVQSIVPPSQTTGRGESSQNRYYSSNDYSFDGDESNDGYSIKSEPTRNGYGPYIGNSRGGGAGSISSTSLSGPRPLPPRSGSAEKMYESAKYNNLGQQESPHVRPFKLRILMIRNFTRNELLRIMDPHGLVCQMYLLYQTLSAEQCLHLR